MTKKLDKLLEKKAQLEARIQSEQNKSKARERKDDTRRKILIGAVVMEAMKKDPSLLKQVNKLLTENLTRDNDRKLFDIPLFPKAKTQDSLQ